MLFAGSRAPGCLLVLRLRPGRLLLAHLVNADLPVLPTAPDEPRERLSSGLISFGSVFVRMTGVFERFQSLLLRLVV